MRAKRSLGQNFLVDPNLQRKIVDALDPTPEGTVVEIGPGHGALTQHLARRVGKLVAVELDDQLARDLALRYQDDTRVEIVHQDVLQWAPMEGGAPALEGGAPALRDGAGPGPGPYRVVGNIPYNITSPIIFHLLEWRPAPERIILMVQKEVADRLAAKAGDRQYGALTVGVQAVARVEKLFTVSRKAFRPAPNVDSAVVRIDPKGALPADRAARLRTLTRAAFGLRRKQMQKILRSAPDYGLPAEDARAALAEVGLRPEDRPEVLTPEQFVRLTEVLYGRGYPRNGEAE